MATTIPYEGATVRPPMARQQITDMLQKFGAEQVGFMDEFDQGTVVLMFRYRGYTVQMKASAAGWAAMFLEAHPWNSRRRCSREGWKEKALRKGQVAVNAMLRDWIKGQLTAVETGLLAFSHVFLPYMVTRSGETVAGVIDRAGGPAKVELLE